MTEQCSPLIDFGDDVPAVAAPVSAAIDVPGVATTDVPSSQCLLDDADLLALLDEAIDAAAADATDVDAAFINAALDAPLDDGALRPEDIAPVTDEDVAATAAAADTAACGACSARGNADEEDEDEDDTKSEQADVAAVASIVDPRAGVAPERIPHPDPPAPIALRAPLHKKVPGSVATYSLDFSATQSQPDYAKLFLATGGSISAAAAAAETDFSLTGGRESTHAQLEQAVPTRLRVPLPDGSFSRVVAPDGTPVIVLDAHYKVNASTQRIGAAINGTLAHTNAGTGSVYLLDVLRAGAVSAPFQVPLIYGTLASHSATVGIADAKIVDDATGDPVDVHFTKDVQSDEIMGAAEQAVDAYAQSAWKLREKRVIFPPSPTLTKTVAKVAVGVNEKGYDAVHNVVGRPFPFGLKALNSLLASSIGLEFGFGGDELREFLEKTAKPGIEAARTMHAVASACSTAANYLVSYRADGRTTMGPTGSLFTAVESWLQSGPRTPCDANDCDGSALLAVSMLASCEHASEEDLELYPFVRAVKHAVSPYYTYGVGVVGAASAEASNADGEKTSGGVAGHAIAMAVPTLSLLAALHRAELADGGETSASAFTGGTGILRGANATNNSSAHAWRVHHARITSVFTPEVRDSLPAHERAAFSAVLATPASLGKEHAITFSSLEKLPPFGMEGTTPASPVLYLPDADARAATEHASARDANAFELAAPNIGRGIKMLHVGGGDRDNPHRFYTSLVEYSLSGTHPLYKHEGLRALGKAASQFVFARKASKGLVSSTRVIMEEPEATGASAAEDTVKSVEAGVTPKQLVENDFVAIPLASVDVEVASLIDFGTDRAAADVIPPRTEVGKGGMRLSEAQSVALARSLTALETLNSDDGEREHVGHAVAYLLSFNSLVSNPVAVEHFVERVSSVAKASLIDQTIVSDLASHADGTDAGVFVVVSAVMPV